MSGAREVGGVRARAGRKASVRANLISKSELEQIRQGLHDFEGRRGRRVARVSKPQWGAYRSSRGRKQRWRPLAWMGRFLPALERTGDITSAATLVGVPAGTVRNYISRDLSLRKECDVRIGRHAERKLQQCAKGLLERWEVTPRTARALMASRAIPKGARP